MHHLCPKKAFDIIFNVSEITLPLAVLPRVCELQQFVRSEEYFHRSCEEEVFVAQESLCKQMDPYPPGTGLDKLSWPWRRLKSQEVTPNQFQ